MMAATMTMEATVALMVVVDDLITIQQETPPGEMDQTHPWLPPLPLITMEALTSDSQSHYFYLCI
jgi:hypothetical protein